MNHYWYKEKCQIYLEPRFCSCQFFIDKGTRKHHVGAAIMAYHVDYHDREFAIVRSRSRLKNLKEHLQNKFETFFPSKVFLITNFIIIV